MKLSLKWNIKNIDSKNKEIIKDLQWHVKKVSNMLLYEIREGKEKIDINKSLNIISSKIYKEYRKNWHSEYLHSHMLQEAIISVIGSYKSCRKLADYLEGIGANIHAKELMKKAVEHDISKVTCDDELRALSMIINDKTTLKDCKCSLSQIKQDSIKLHWKHNSHHPEHFATPEDMKRIDIMEMVCDWYVRSLQYGTNFLDYVKEKQETRFKFPEWMFAEIWHYCEILAR